MESYIGLHPPTRRCRSGTSAHPRHRITLHPGKEPQVAAMHTIRTVRRKIRELLSSRTSHPCKSVLQVVAALESYIGLHPPTRSADSSSSVRDTFVWSMAAEIVLSVAKIVISTMTEMAHNAIGLCEALLVGDQSQPAQRRSAQDAVTHLRAPSNSRVQVSQPDKLTSLAWFPQCIAQTRVIRHNQKAANFTSLVAWSTLRRGEVAPLRKPALDRRAMIHLRSDAFLWRRERRLKEETKSYDHALDAPPFPDP